MAAEPKDTTSFFRKVVKFVANPTTDWAELDAPAEDTRENDYAKGELKAMIERKRRNDFVRKREFDMLRKVRREGLTERAARRPRRSSRIDDSAAAHHRPAGAPGRHGVKAKIDEIEQQMVGDDATPTTSAARPEFYNAPTAAGRRCELARAPARPAAPPPPPAPIRRRPRRGFRRRAPRCRAAGARRRHAAAGASPLDAPIRLDMPPAATSARPFAQDQ